VDEIVDGGHLVGNEVDTPETKTCQYTVTEYQAQVICSPSVAVARGEAHEASSKVVLVNEGAELAALMGSVTKSLVVVANDGLGDESGEVVRVVPANTLNSNGDVGGGKGVVTDADVRADEVGLLLGQERSVGDGGGGGKTGKVLVGHLNELLVGNATSADKDHAVSGVVVLDVVGELGAADVADVLAGAEDGAAKGLVLEGSGVEVVEDNLLELLLNLLRLAQDDVAFALDGGLLELGVLENVLEDVDALGNVLVQSLGEVDGVLALFARVSDDRRSVGKEL